MALIPASKPTEMDMKGIVQHLILVCTVFLEKAIFVENAI